MASLPADPFRSNIQKGQFLCPVCRRLSNTLIPLIPPTLSSSVTQSTPLSSPVELSEFLEWIPQVKELSESPLPDNPSLPACRSLVESLAQKIQSIETPNSLSLFPLSPSESEGSLYNAILTNCRLAELFQRHSDMGGEILRKRTTLNLLLPAALLQSSCGKKDNLLPLISSIEGKACGAEGTLSHLPFLSVDPFDFIVRLSLLWPSGPLQVFPQLSQVGYLLQILQAIQWLHHHPSCISSPDSHPPHPLTSFYAFVVRHLTSSPPSYLSSISPELLESSLLRLTQPFLWRTSFFRSLFDLKPDASLPPSSPAMLLEELNLPPLTLFASYAKALEGPIQRWFGQLLEVKEQMTISPLGGFPRPTQLVDLPSSFQEIVLRFVGVRCEECHTVPKQVAICLICGKMCCVAVECCVRDGKAECFRHSKECGGGVFLMLKSTYLLLLRDDRRTAWGSIYFDERGEEDPGIRRGKPLFLDPSRYAVLRRLWLSGGFDYDSHILENTVRDAQHM